MTKLIALKQATATTSIRDLGEFTVKSDAIRFTDPCYGNDTWCKGSLPAVNGQWQAKLGFFRDSYDEKSLVDGMAIEAKAKEIVKALTYAAKTELEPIYKKLKEYTKEQRPKTIPYEQTDLSDLTRPIIASIIKFSNETIVPHSWKTEDESALATLLDILGLALGHSWRIPDRLIYRIAMLEFNHEKGELTDEQVYEQTKEHLIAALEDMEQKSKKAFDDGHPRRTQFLHIKHGSVPDFTPFDQELWIEHDGFDVGVDSGQAGFFDEAWFEDYGNECKDDDRSAKWEEIYDMLSELSLGKCEYNPKTGQHKECNYAGTFEFGCNGFTAHGDGSVPLYYRTNENGEVVEAVYHYDITYDNDNDTE